MPYVSVDIDLYEFDTDDLIEELESRGYACSKHKRKTDLGGLDDLEHIEHLAVCGQAEAARAEALELVSKAIGRNLQ